MWKALRWVLLGIGIAAVLAAAAFLLWLFVPRQIDMNTQGLLIHSDGTAEITNVQITGSWKPVLFDDVKQEFTGALRVEGLDWLNRDDMMLNTISFQNDVIANSDGLIGADFIRQQNTQDLLGNLWIWTNRDMDGFIMIATENGASTVTWVIVPAQSIEDAIAIRDEWGLPETEFNWN